VSETRNAGFTLIEILVSMVVLILFMVGMLTMLDRSRTIAKQESALSDTQENVRYAAYHLLRTARMCGGAGMPMSRSNSGTWVWVAGQIDNLSTSAFTDDFGNTHSDAVPGSDVLTLRGFFEVRPYFVAAGDVDTGTDTVTINDTDDPLDPNDAAMNDMQADEDAFIGRGIALMGRGQYRVAEVSDNDGCSGCTSFDIDFASGNAPWEAMNPPNGVFPAGTFPFEVYRVGILDSYTYYVNADHNLMRIRSGGTPEPVAINIGNLQVALGMDSNDDGNLDTWFPAPTAVEADTGIPVALRITVLGRTREQIPNWREPAETFAVENLNIGTVDREAKWRRMQVVAMLRDFQL